MRTTINISDAILAEMRERARQRKRPFREVLEEALHTMEHSATVFSNDRDFDRFPGIKRVNPLS